MHNTHTTVQTFGGW